MSSNMKRIVCKILVFAMICLLLVPTFAGCARESADEMLHIAAEQLEKTKTVNAICFGKGLTPGEEGGYQLSGYAEATVESRAAFGVDTVEEIFALMRECYSTAACDYIDTVVFNPVKEESTFASFSRYFDAMDGKDNVCLMVKKGYTPLSYGDVSYANIRLEKHTRSRATVLVDVTVTEGELSRTDKNIKLDLRYEDGVWKFDTLTYASIR